MLWSDFKFAVRGLIGAPGLSAAAVLALALGIGPNTAIFSIVYATLLAPLPFSNPDQLARVTPMAGNAQDRASAAEYLEWKKRATSFQALEAFRPGRTLNLAIGDAPEIVIARQVTPGGHSMLSDRVFLGRDFRADEDQPGKQHVVLLTHRLWRERFGADRDIIGRDIRMDSIPYTVVGVLEPGSWDRTPANVWIPISFTPAEIANRQLHPLIVDGRLKPGVTVEQAQQEMNTIAADLARQFPDSYAGRTVRLVPLDTAILNSSRTMVAGTGLQPLLWSLLAAVSFVVLMACVNVANLLLSRGVTRERETAIRAALGATRGRLMRLALIEGVVHRRDRWCIGSGRERVDSPGHPRDVAALYPGIYSRPETEPAGLTVRAGGDDVRRRAERLGAGLAGWSNEFQ